MATRSGFAGMVIFPSACSTVMGKALGLLLGVLLALSFLVSGEPPQPAMPSRMAVTARMRRLYGRFNPYSTLRIPLVPALTRLDRGPAFVERYTVLPQALDLVR
ncbi:hypothetical protein GCM10009525_81170 [Streptosporangium amethystogenes subsp. fukuiense]